MVQVDDSVFYYVVSTKISDQDLFKNCNVTRVFLYPRSTGVSDNKLTLNDLRMLFGISQTNDFPTSSFEGNSGSSFVPASRMI